MQFTSSVSPGALVGRLAGVAERRAACRRSARRACSRRRRRVGGEVRVDGEAQQAPAGEVVDLRPEVRERRRGGVGEIVEGLDRPALLRDEHSPVGRDLGVHRVVQPADRGALLEARWQRQCAGTPGQAPSTASRPQGPDPEAARAANPPPRGRLRFRAAMILLPPAHPWARASQWRIQRGERSSSRSGLEPGHGRTSGGADAAWERIGRPGTGRKCRGGDDTPDRRPAARATLSCQTARAPSSIVPGLIASSVVLTEHVAPIAAGVAAHGTGDGQRDVGDRRRPPARSVTRTVVRARGRPCSRPGRRGGARP